MLPGWPAISSCAVVLVVYVSYGARARYGTAIHVPTSARVTDGESRRMPKSTPTVRPIEIKLHQASRALEICFEDGVTFSLPCEYLRVYSPSAEVSGVGELQVYKEDVNIDEIKPIGNYAVRLYFSDGHNTGVYSWKALYELGRDMDKNWADYLQRLRTAGYKHRDLS